MLVNVVEDCAVRINLEQIFKLTVAEDGDIVGGCLSEIQFKL